MFNVHIFTPKGTSTILKPAFRQTMHVVSAVKYQSLISPVRLIFG